MSYDLSVTFEPPVRRSRWDRYFTSRPHYAVAKDQVVYEHPDTGVYFTIDVAVKRTFMVMSAVERAAIAVNVFRPSYFGREVAGELESLLGAFPNRIEDPQVDGIGGDRFETDAFLRGWDRTNAFGAEAIAPQADHPPPRLPRARLDECWAWNHARADRQRAVGERQFVPTILFFSIRGATQTAVAWGEGLPILLPKVDAVVVGRPREDASGVRTSDALVSWADLAPVLAAAGLHEADGVIDIAYDRIPGPLFAFLDALPEVAPDDLAHIPPDRVVDAELLP